MGPPPHPEWSEVSESVVPHPKALIPTGMPEELEKLGLPTAVYRSCSPPDPGTNAGCVYWELCEMPYKGLSGVDEEGYALGGPHNHGVLYITFTGKTDQNVSPCYGFMSRVVAHRQSRNVYEIVADEGEAILVKGTEEVPVNPAVPHGKKRSKRFSRSMIVPRHPRPAEVFHDKVYEMKVREAIRGRERRQRLSRAMGDQQEGESARLEGV